MKHYGIKADPETQQIKCMITGLQVPAASIRAGHLFPLRLDVSVKSDTGSLPGAVLSMLVTVQRLSALQVSYKLYKRDGLR